jgi:phosphate-selective porin
LASLALACGASAPARAQRPDSTAFKFTAVFLYDLNTFGQDTASERQVGSLSTAGHIRTDRYILKGFVRGRLPFHFHVSADVTALERGGDVGVTVNDFATIFPVGGSVSVALGRQKEGATIGIMTSRPLFVFTERPAPISAVLPTRNDGIRVTGGEAARARWSIGAFNQALIRHTPFDLASTTGAARVFTAPVLNDSVAQVVQIGASVRWSGAPNDSLEFKTTPETQEVADFVKTGSFAASSTVTGGLEGLLQWRSLSMAGEALVTRAAGTDSGGANFGGAYAELSWRPFGERRVYDARDGVFGKVRLDGRRPALELAARYSSTDLDGGVVRGGRFDRASVVVSVYGPMATHIEVDYGYGTLWRSNLKGRTQFLTTRMQIGL